MKAFNSIFFREPGSIISLSPLFSNALSPSTVRPSGRAICVRLLQQLNALYYIFFNIIPSQKQPLLEPCTPQKCLFPAPAASTAIPLVLAVRYKKLLYKSRFDILQVSPVPRSGRRTLNSYSKEPDQTLYEQCSGRRLSLYSSLPTLFATRFYLA